VLFRVSLCSGSSATKYAGASHVVWYDTSPQTGNTVVRHPPVRSPPVRPPPVRSPADVAGTGKACWRWLSWLALAEVAGSG